MHQRALWMALMSVRTTAKKVTMKYIVSVHNRNDIGTSLKEVRNSPIPGSCKS